MAGRHGRGWGLAALAAGLLVGAGVFWWRAEAPPSARGADGPVLSASRAPAPAAGRREMRPTLDPARFVGKAARAHQVAREIPDVLDRLYCYCECDKHVGHKSLLSCYTDGHAAT
jgi:hypothetical protein